MRFAHTVERLAWWLGLAVLVWVLASFVFLPLGAALARAFLRDGSLGIVAVAAELAASRRVVAAIWNTLWMTAATTVAVAVVGIFQVVVLDYVHIRGRAILKIGYAVPLVFGSVVAASGYNFTYGPNGVVTHGLAAVFPGLARDWFLGWFGVLYIHAFLMTSYYFLFLRAALRRVDHATIEAARNLGASEWTILTRVVGPVLLPTLLAVVLLTVYTAIGSFAAPQILGGRDFTMLSQIILTLNSLRRPDMAALLALGLSVVVMSLIVLAQHLEARAGQAGGARTAAPIVLKRVRNPAANAVLHGLAYLLFAIEVLPVALVVLFSFAPAASIGVDTLPSTLTLANYARVLSGGAALKPFLNSVEMGVLAVAAGLALTLFAVPLLLRRRNTLTRLVDLGLFLPWAIPSLLLAVGLIAAFDRPNWLIGGGVLVGSFWILPVGYTVVVLPLMVRFLRAAFAGIDPVYEEAARALGASAFYRFRRVVLPLVAPTAVLVAAMAFNDIMTEYPLSAFLYNVNNRPLPVAIVDGSVGGDPDQAAITLVYASLIMAFSLAVILAAERLGLGRGPKAGGV